MSTTAAPVRRYRITEVSRLTGFTATTLRFYENAGVLAPPPRTSAGHRTYDDRDVERLRLIARAKDLGCTLKEIAGLIKAWDADECGPVKHQLRVLVNAKVTDIHDRIADLTRFAAKLAATAAALASRPVDGPCDASCGCITSVTVVPSGRSAAPTKCSLGPGGVKARIDEWRAMLADVEERQLITDGLRLRLRPHAPVAEITRLAAAERECCPFFAFAITVDGRGIALEVTAPAGGQALLASVFGTAP